jgi:hypothetical protein
VCKGQSAPWLVETWSGALRMLFPGQGLHRVKAHVLPMDSLHR